MDKKSDRLYIILYIILTLAMWLGILSLPHPPIVNAGSGDVLDVTALDLSEAVYTANGFWVTYPEQLYTPEDLRYLKQEPAAKGSVDYTVVQYATHVMKLKVEPNKTYGLYLRSADYAMRLFIDGKEVALAGMPGTTREETVPHIAERVYSFSSKSENITMIMQAANFVHKEGAYPSVPKIGELVNVQRMQTFDLLITILTSACLLSGFLYHMGLFILNRSHISNMLFAICCLLLAFLSNRIIPLLAGDYNWMMAFRFEYIIHYLTFAAFAIFLQSLYVKLAPKFLLGGYVLWALINVGVVFFTDSLFFTRFIKTFDLVSIGLIAIILLRMLFMLKKGNTQRYLYVVGLMALAAFTVNDILARNNIIELITVSGQPFTAPIGMMFFMFTYTLALSKDNAVAERNARESELKLMADNESLSRMNRMKMDLIETIAHETRTPLAVMSGYAQLVAIDLKKKGADAQTTEDLGRISDEAQRISTLLDELQDFVDKKEGARRNASVQIGDIIAQCARLYRPLLAHEDTNLRIDIQKKMPTVFANPDELTQVLFNLLQNSRNHTKAGYVKISAKVVEEKPDEDKNKAIIPGKYVQVCVSDSGTGISPEFLPKAFKRGEHEFTGGSGVGLAVCQEIVLAHGGRIWIESTKQKGTKVYFTLPAEEEVVK